MEVNHIWKGCFHFSGQTYQGGRIFMDTLNCSNKPEPVNVFRGEFCIIAVILETIMVVSLTSVNYGQHGSLIFEAYLTINYTSLAD